MQDVWTKKYNEEDSRRLTCI